MADRHSLCRQNIEEFKVFLSSRGYAIADPVGSFEVLRPTHKDRRHPIIVYRRARSSGGGELVHYSCLDRDMPIVREFFKSKKQKGATS